MAFSFTLPWWHLIYLLGFLSNALALPESISGSLEERVAGSQSHPPIFEKRHDNFATDSLPFATLERRDVLEEENGLDVLGRRDALVDSIQKPRSKHLQSDGATSRQESNWSGQSSHRRTQPRRPSSSLPHHRPDKAVQSLRSHSNPQSTPPCTGFLCNVEQGRNGGSRDGGSVLHSEVSELYKRDAATSGKSQPWPRPFSQQHRKPGNGFYGNLVPSGGRTNSEVSELYKRDAATSGKGQSQHKPQHLYSSQLTQPSPKYLAPFKNRPARYRSRPQDFTSGFLKAGGSANGGPITHSEALDLYKRDAATSSRSQSLHRTSLQEHHNPGVTTRKQNSLYSPPSTQPSSEYSALLNYWSPKHRSRPHTSMSNRIQSGGSGNGGVVTHAEALDLYKRDAAKGLQLQGHKPEAFGRISAQNGGKKEFRNNMALQGTDVYRRDSSSDGEVFSNELLAKRAGIPRHSAHVKPGTQHHHQYHPSTFGGGRQSAWSGSHIHKLLNAGKGFINNMALGDSEMYRRDETDTNSEIQARSPEVPQLDLLRRFWRSPAGHRRTGNTNSGSVSSMFSSSELYKRGEDLASDIDTDTTLLRRVGRRPYQGGRGSVSHMNPAAELWRRDEDGATDKPDTDADLLTFILEYLALQTPSSTSASTSSSYDDSMSEAESVTSDNTKVNDESLDDLAANIQKLADGLDNDDNDNDL